MEPVRHRMRCYHKMPLSQVCFGQFQADPQYSDKWDARYVASYSWLEEQIGFYPIFLSFGNKYAIGMTQYQYQFDRRRRLAKGEKLANNVLFEFSLDMLDSPVFTDYSWWCYLNGRVPGELGHNLHYSGRLFKRTWTRNRWLALARKHARLQEAQVQLLVAGLDLRKACKVWVRNKATQRQLERMGFTNVHLKVFRFNT